MGSNDEFGPDTDAIRRWLAQRDTYRSDAGRHRGDAPTRTATPEWAERTAPAAPAAQAAPPAAPPQPPRPAGPDARDAGRSVLEALGAVEPPPAPARPTEPSRPATAAEARLDALITPPASPTDSQPEVEPEAGPEAAEEPAPRHKAPAAKPLPPRDDSTAGTSTDQDFTPRSRAHAVLSVLLLLTLLATAGAAYFAATQPSVGTYGIAGTLGVLLLVVWAVRSSTTATSVRVRRGVLEIRRGGGLEVADLANPYTPIAILGVPEKRSWRVLIERVDRPLLEIDASMVEPYAFTGLLLRLRPDLWDAAVDDARIQAGITPKP